MPVALDLYCKAGGAARGIAAAGFTVIGVDIEPQPNYPYQFIQADVLDLGPAWLSGFDFIWASPPCLDNTSLRNAPNAKKHRDLIAPTRKLLKATGKPYCIENVDSPRARKRLRNPTRLCGTMFNLYIHAAAKPGLAKRTFELRRHRLFETNFPLEPISCNHALPVVGVYGGHVRTRSAAVGGRVSGDFQGEDRPKLAAQALGLPEGCMTMEEYSNAIPPAMAEWIAMQVPHNG